MTVKKIEQALKGLVRLQAYLFRKNELTKCALVDQKISALVRSKNDLLEEAYANEETCKTWWWHGEEEKAEEGVDMGT